MGRKGAIPDPSSGQLSTSRIRRRTSQTTVAVGRELLHRARSGLAVSLTTCKHDSRAQNTAKTLATPKSRAAVEWAYPASAQLGTQTCTSRDHELEHTCYDSKALPLRFSVSNVTAVPVMVPNMCIAWQG